MLVTKVTSVLTAITTVTRIINFLVPPINGSSPWKSEPWISLGSTVELTLVVGEVGMLALRAWEQESSKALAGPASQWGIGAVLESRPWRCKCWRAGKVTSSATTQAQIQDSELSHPNIYLHLWTARACEGFGTADPKLQDLHDTGQQQEIWEESQWRARIDGIAEARGLEPYQWPIAMNFCK